MKLHKNLVRTHLILALMLCVSFAWPTLLKAALPFTTGNLVVLQAAASAANTTCSILELNPATAAQGSPVNTVAISGTGANALRISGSATSTGYLANSDDGTLLAFTGANNVNTSANVNTLNPRGVGTLDNAGNFVLQTTYTGASGNQTRCATSLNNSGWYVGEQGGVYTNGTTTAVTTGNFRGLKSFGGALYIFQQSSISAVNIVVSSVSADAKVVTGLPGLTNDTAGQDFYMVSSGSNGSTFDTLYVLTSTSATAGIIKKYSLVSGSWTANGTYTTSFGGFGLCATKNGGGAYLYVTTGTGATTANSVIRLTDTAGYNATIAITTANNLTLYTGAAGTIMKGIAFAPASGKPTPTFSNLTSDQSILAGTASVTLAGKVSATGPLYPSISELVSVTINGTSVTNTFADVVGNFSFNFSTATIPAGAYQINYSYPGSVTLNAAANSSTTLTVTNSVITPNQPPTVSLTNPVNNASFAAPARIVLGATAADSDGFVTNVAFFQGTTKLADDATAPYTFTWSGVTSGTYTLTAVATDNLGASTTSSVVNVTVTNVPLLVSSLPPIQTVFVIAMENHNWTQPTPGSSPQQIFGNVAAPYVNSLVTPGNTNAAQVSYCTRYYNAGVGVHGSEPNYVWAEAGTDFGVHTDNDPSAGSGNIFTAPHLTAQLNTAGIAWKNYQEDVQYSSSPLVSKAGSGVPVNPYHGTTQYDYGVKHNPMAFFSDTQTQNVFAFTNFLNHLTNGLIGRYNWITPDEFNNMHSALTGGFTYKGTAYTGDQAAVAQGDNFLSKFVPQIMASPAYKTNGVIIIWWDETEGGDTTNQTIAEIIISPLAKGNAYNSSLEYSHSSDVKFIENVFGLSYLSNAIPAAETRAAGSGYNNVATVSDLSDLFVSGIPPASFMISNLSGNGFKLSFNLATNQTYRILASSQINLPLSNWTQIASGTVVTNPVIFTDTNIFGARFYRALSP
jgi:hypothetical protein